MATYLKRKDVATRYNISQSALNNYVKKGLFPYGVKIGNSRRWNSDELDAFDREQLSNSKFFKEEI